LFHNPRALTSDVALALLELKLKFTDTAAGYAVLCFEMSELCVKGIEGRYETGCAGDELIEVNRSELPTFNLFR
jgi:hypothetical protein